MAIGCPHPELLFEPRGPLSWNQFLDWIAFHDVAPFGDRRADARQAVLYWAILAPHVDRGERPAAPSITWPYFEPVDVPTIEHVSAQAEALRVYAEVMSRGESDDFAIGDPNDAQRSGNGARLGRRQLEA